MRSLPRCASGRLSYVIFHEAPYNLWGSVMESDVKNEGLMTTHSNAAVPLYGLLSV
jgi:hypothetical protein